MAQRRFKSWRSSRKPLCVGQDCGATTVVKIFC